MLTILIFLIGLFLGSFLGVVVDRLNRKETVIKGRSYCEKCKKELNWYDLIPVVSFVSTNGKCRYCGVKLSIYYPAIEIITGVLFLLTYLFVTSGLPFSLINLLYYLFMVSSFIVIFFHDLKYGIIPDKVLLPAISVSLIYLLIINLIPLNIYQNFQGGTFLVHILSGVGAFLFFLTISYLFFIIKKKQGMGGGDIKLSFLLGLFLGFPNIIVCLYLAFLTGAILSIILILWKKKRFLKDSLPFGPFLILGALISLFWGNQIYNFFLPLFGI